MTIITNAAVANATTSYTDLITFANASMVTYLQATNMTSSTTSVTVQHVLTNSGVNAYPAYSTNIPATGTLGLLSSEKYYVGGGDVIRILASANSAINVEITYVEING